MLNPIEEAKFAELKEKCRELGVPAPLEIHIGLLVKDRNGDVIFDDKQRGHSWTRNWYNHLLGLAGAYATGATYGAGHISAKDVDGTVYGTTSVGSGAFPVGQVLTTYGYPGYVRGLANSNLSGIVVGTGDTAFSANQFTMAAIIAHGTGAGQFVYNLGGEPSANYDDSAGSEKWTITLARIFNNNSGNAVVVKETGLISMHYTEPNNQRSVARFFRTSSVTFAVYYLDERSVLSPTVNVPNGAQLTVTYEITMDFSAID